MSEHEDFMERLEAADILDGVGVPRVTPPPRQEGMTDARHATNCASLQDVRGCGPCTCGVPDARGEPMTREALQRVTAQIRAWDKQSVAFDAAIQQIHAHDADQRETIARLQEQLRLCNIDQLQAEQQVTRLRMLIYRLLNDLPTNRDWLDPELEQALRETGA